MEQIDDLQNGYFIIQKDNAFKFGVDAVLLADFVRSRPQDKILDMCSGTGIVPILLYAKGKSRDICGLEIQEEMVELSKRSIIYNHLEDYIDIKHMDLKQAADILGKSSYDIVTCNPPYMKVNDGINNTEEAQAIARFEIKCTLEDVIINAKKLLKSGGKLFMVHRADRLIDIITVMKVEGLEPKRIRFIHPSISKAPNLILIEGVRNGKSQLKIMDPLYVYDTNGNYTKQIDDIYGRIK